jgi:O-antigen ligase
VLLSIAALFAFQTVLTFARGGIALALAGTFAAMFVLLRSKRTARVAVVSVGLISFAVGKYVVEPRLEQQTSGQVAKRFSNAQPSGRDQLVESELGMFVQNPAIGVGPGMGTDLRLANGEIGPSHTEYSRMLGEHGALGVLSLLCLVGLGFRAVRSSRDAKARAVSYALTVWAALFLAVYSTRLAAPAFAFGLAFAVPRVKPAARKAPLAQQPAQSR